MAAVGVDTYWDAGNKTELTITIEGNLYNVPHL